MVCIFVEHLSLFLKVTQIQAGGLMLMTADPHRAIVFFLVEIQSPGALESSRLYPVQLQKLNIGVWNPIMHSKFKHVELDVFFVREKVAASVLQVGHVSSEDQVADVLTKPLSAMLFTKFRRQLQVAPYESQKSMGNVMTSKLYSFGLPSVESIAKRFLNPNQPFNETIDTPVEAYCKVRINLLVEDFNEVYDHLDVLKEKQKAIVLSQQSHGTETYHWWKKRMFY
ncbi:hypothetical protein CXB51_012211 [Gossypium anomalum]|uniref:Uncharacterized protein n=1 Tax=Gossypium anomalum TaxID=47600 RepID=A0A8J5YWH8_9ROSI|nr:hypothetical protein CXB51_012211 [Gossypium anomalum]